MYFLHDFIIIVAILIYVLTFALYVYTVEKSCGGSLQAKVKMCFIMLGHVYCM